MPRSRLWRLHSSAKTHLRWEARLAQTADAADRLAFGLAVGRVGGAWCCAPEHRPCEDRIRAADGFGSSADLRRSKKSQGARICKKRLDRDPAASRFVD